MHEDLGLVLYDLIKDFKWITNMLSTPETPQYSRHTSKVGVKRKSINQLYITYYFEGNLKQNEN